MSMFICTEDYLDEAVRTVSSEAAAFPDSNLYDQSARGVVWRSAGYFEVTSANKTIIFQETIGVNLTATIAEANYASITTFLAAVVVALEAAGASEYTATQNATTKKIVLTSDGGGGGGVFRLMWTHASTTAEDLLGYDNAADDTGALTYTADYVRIHTSEWLKWDLGATSNPDAFIAIGRKNLPIKLTATATINLQGNSTDSWGSPAYDQTITYDELALCKIKASGDGLHTTGLRYWRLKIVDKDNVNGYVELSNVYLGEYYETTQGMPQFPFSISHQDYSSSVRFDSGSTAFNRRERCESFSFDWLGLNLEEKETFDGFQRDLGNSKAFFMIFDPEAAFSSIVNYNVRYVRFDSSNISLQLPNIWQASWSLEEMV